MTDKELFPLNSEKAVGKDPKKLFLHYAHYWYLFGIGSIVSVGIAFLYLKYYAVPQYSVHSSILIKDDKSGQDLSNADVLNDLNTFKSIKNIDNEIEVLKSESIMERVVKELSLSTRYYEEGPVIDKELYGRTSPIKVLSSNVDSTIAEKSFTIYPRSDNSFKLEDNTGAVSIHRFGQQVTKPYGKFTVLATPTKGVPPAKIFVYFQNAHQVSNYYNKAISIQPVSKSSSVLVLSLMDPIPERAENIINKLMQTYRLEGIEDKNIMNVSTLKFLDERLTLITAELSAVEKGVEKYKSTNELTDITTQATGYAKQSTDYNAQLTERAIQIEVLESIENYLKKNSGQSSLVPSTLGIKDETLLGLIGRFNELQLNRERMLRTMQPTSLLIQNLNEQLDNLRANILENLQNIKRGLQIVNINLKANSGQFQSKIRRVPGMERELLEINRQQSIKQTIYAYLLQKREATALALAATASNARVIDSARGGDYPISPNQQTIYLAAILLGLGIPFAGLYVVGLFNNKVQSQQDVTDLVNAPIIGEIAHNKKQETVVVTKGNRSPIAEMFQLVRTNLHFAALDKEKVVLLVTSSMSGEGKTFFSINLGASLAVTGKRVVLLDLDLREPKVATDLGFDSGPGITDYLISADMQIDNILRTTERVPGLFVITSGIVPPNPVELMMSAKFTHLIAKLKEEFDYIIMDTPPVGLVADAFTLSQFVDLTVYIVRYNYTHKGQLDIIQNISRNKTLSRPMIVLNDAKEINGSNYGYGYGYGYKQKSKKKAVVS